MTNEEEIKLLQAYQNLRAFWYELKKDYVWLEGLPQFNLTDDLTPVGVVNEFEDALLEDMAYAFNAILTARNITYWAWASDPYWANARSLAERAYEQCGDSVNFYKKGVWKTHLHGWVDRVDKMLAYTNKVIDECSPS